MVSLGWLMLDKQKQMSYFCLEYRQEIVNFGKDDVILLVEEYFSEEIEIQTVDFDSKKLKVGGNNLPKDIWTKCF